MNLSATVLDKRGSEKQMAQYQSQSQWENELQNMESAVSSSAEKQRGIVVSKKTLILGGGIVLTIFCLLLVLYAFGRPLEGTWVRQSDDNSTLSGMKVEVRNNGGKLEGTIVSMPDGAYAFEEGQIKWAEIKKVGFGKYQCVDLSFLQPENIYSYEGSTLLSVGPGGKQMTLQTVTNQIVQRGRHQLWLKEP